MLPSGSCKNNTHIYHNLTKSIDDILHLSRGPTLDKQVLKPVQKIFQEIANSNPSNIALTSENRTYTYRELQEWSDKIAQDLLSKRVTAEDRVVIFMEQSASMIAAAIGILKCGAAYVPLDVNQPDRRLTKIFIDAEISCILVDKKSLHKVRDINCTSILVEEDFSNATIKTLNLCPELRPVSLDSPAYLIYTSGSTGEPKGVIIGHNELAHSTFARSLIYPGKPVFLLVSPIFYDSSIAGIWGTLTSGGHLVVATYDECRDPEALINLITKYNVTMTLCIPSLYESLLDVIEKSGTRIVSSLNTVIVAGETLHQSLVNRHFELLGTNVELVNEYGPTESTVWASYQKFSSPETVSIGRPLPGTSIYLLNEDLELTPKGQVGEVFIGGGQLAKGYYKNDEATQKAFIPDPFVNKEGSRMYKTGDLARWNDDGKLDFIGRKDHQVKIRGYRIELGAIESVLYSFPNVREAAVIANKELTELSAFVVCNKEYTPKCLREMLEMELPSHMVPSKIIIMDHLPQTRNGKIDRNTLIQHKNNSDRPSIDSSCTSNDDIGITAQVSRAWKQLLNLDSVPEDVNFFDLGGHSLMVFKLQQSLEKHTNFKPPIVALFRHTTVSAQAEYIFSQIKDIDHKYNPSSEAAA